MSRPETRLSQRAFNVALTAYHKIPQLAGFGRKKRDDARGAITAVMQRAGYAIALAGPGSPDITPDDILALDFWLRDLRARDPSVKTYESKARSAIRSTGIDLPTGHGRTRESPAWSEYLKRCPKLPPEMPGFASAATAAGVEPDKLTQAFVVAYHDALLAEGRPLQSVQIAVRRVVACLRTTAPGKGTEVFSVPGVVDRRVMRDDLAPLILEQSDSWRRFRLEGSSSLKAVDDGAAEREAYLLRLLASEHHTITGCKLRSLADLARRKAARIATQGMQERSKRRNPNADHPAEAYEAARVLCNIVRCGFLERETGTATHPRTLRELEKFATTLSPKETELSMKVHDKLREFVKWERARALLDLPENMLNELPEGDLSPRQRPQLSLALAMQLTIDIGELPDELSTLTLGNLKRTGSSSDSTFEVHLDRGSGRRTKAGELSRAGIRLFEAYIERVLGMDRITSGDDDAPLFPGRGRRQLSAARFSRRLAELTQKKLGCALSVRDLRWVVAFLTLAQDPEARDLAAGYLGHRKDRAIKALVILVSDWRKSGRFGDFPSPSRTAI